MSKLNKLEILRHSTAHVLAAAVQKLYSKTKFGMGPFIENGFYYDFDFSPSLSPENLPKIEKEMKRIIKSENLKKKN